MPATAGMTMKGFLLIRNNSNACCRDSILSWALAHIWEVWGTRSLHNPAILPTTARNRSLLPRWTVHQSCSLITCGSLGIPVIFYCRGEPLWSPLTDGWTQIKKQEIRAWFKNCNYSNVKKNVNICNDQVLGKKMYVAVWLPQRIFWHP